MRIQVKAKTAIEATGDLPARSIGDEWDLELSEFNGETMDLVGESQEDVRADQLAQIGRQIGDDLRAELGPIVTAALRDAGAGRVTERPAADLVPAGSAGRTQLASLSQHRYDRLPENERALRSPESDVAVQRYFQGMIRKDHSMMLDALEITEGIGGVRGERAALAEGVAATGGNLVPTPLAAMIVEKRQDVEVIGPRSRMFTSQNQSIAIPTQATLMTAALTTEGAAIAATDPTFGQVVLSKKKIATATRSSRELLDDSPFDLFGQVADMAAKAIALQYSASDADGANFTDAIFISSAPNVIDAAVAALTIAEMETMYYTQPSRYRAGSVWLMHADTVEIVAGLVDTSGTTGRRWFEPAGGTPVGLNGGQGASAVGTILGLPVLEESQGIPGLASAEMCLANLDYYGTLDDGGLRVEASDQFAFLEDEIVWKFIGRRDGAVLQGEAFQVYRGITS